MLGNLRVQSVLDLIESGDLFSLVILMILLCGIGARMIESEPKLKRWGTRLAAAALVAYCIYAGSSLGMYEPGPLLGILIRGLFAAGLTLGASWIILTVYGFLKGASDRASAQARIRADARQREREQKQAEAERQRQQREWELAAPERERQQQSEEMRRKEAEQQERTEQEQRDDIRYSCELFFNLNAIKITDRFTRDDLEKFFTQYMNDEQSPEVVQRRANQLLETIRQHVDAVNPPENFATLEDLATWYTTQRQQIENMEINELIKREYLVQLQERYAELSEQLMESLRP